MHKKISTFAAQRKDNYQFYDEPNRTLLNTDAAKGIVKLVANWIEWNEFEEEDRPYRNCHVKFYEKRWRPQLNSYWMQNNQVEISINGNATNYIRKMWPDGRFEIKDWWICANTPDYCWAAFLFSPFKKVNWMLIKCP